MKFFVSLVLFVVRSYSYNYLVYENNPDWSVFFPLGCTYTGEDVISWQSVYCSDDGSQYNFRNCKDAACSICNDTQPVPTTNQIFCSEVAPKIPSESIIDVSYSDPNCYFPYSITWWTVNTCWQNTNDTSCNLELPLL